MDTMSFETAQNHSDRFQKAVTEVTVSEFCSGTLVYVDKKCHEGGWLVMFPDGVYRCVARDDVRLCW